LSLTFLVVIHISCRRLFRVVSLIWCGHFCFHHLTKSVFLISSQAKMHLRQSFRPLAASIMTTCSQNYKCYNNIQFQICLHTPFFHSMFKALKQLNVTRTTFVFSDRKISKYIANIHGLTQHFLTVLTTQSSSHSKLLKNQQFKRKNNF
jgi:hypothetical protein